MVPRNMFSPVVIRWSYSRSIYERTLIIHEANDTQHTLVSLAEAPLAAPFRVHNTNARPFAHCQSTHSSHIMLQKKRMFCDRLHQYRAFVFGDHLVRRLPAAKLYALS